ncbi:MAG: hypothetical protein O7J95_20480 [Planctomycetota bacterium]|nr:hypothetical protein [Planctomycetota bacterium]
MASPFSYRLAQEIAAEFRRHEVKYLFLGKSGAIILGFPDTTQDADLFVEKSADNCRALVRALVALGFPLDETRQDEVLRGKDFVQLREGPFDLDLVFALDGIETFAEAEKRSLVVDGLPVCHIDDIIRSKEEAGRVKDREVLPRLKAFRDWWVESRRRGVS